MGRPLNKKYFGPTVPGGLQLACEAWIDGDTEARMGYIARQNGSDRYQAVTGFGEGQCYLVDEITGPGQMTVQVVAEGYSGIKHARKITDREVYTYGDLYFPYWNPINGQIVFGNQPLSEYWFAAYGDIENDHYNTFAEGCAYDSEGNLIVVGALKSQSQGSIMKLDTNGGIIWQKSVTWVDSDSTVVELVATDSSNNIYALVTDQDNSALTMTKLTPAGVVTWQTTVAVLTAPLDITVGADGSSAFTCFNDNSGHRAIVAFNPDGTVRFQKDLTHATASLEWGAVGFSGTNLVVGLGFSDTGLGRGIMLTAVNTSGAQVWNKTLQVPQDFETNAFGLALDTDSAGNVYAQCYYSNNISGEVGIHYMKLDSSGTIIWQTDVGVEEGDLSPFSLVVNDDGEVFSQGGVGEGAGVVFIKLNADGTFDWATAVANIESYVGYWYRYGTRDIAVTDGKFAFAGFQGLPDKDETYSFICQLPADGSGAGTAYGIYYYVGGELPSRSNPWTAVSSTLILTSFSHIVTSGAWVFANTDWELALTGF